MSHQPSDSSSTDLASTEDSSPPPESDPSNRYQRCDQILGEGAYKVVYRAFDQEEGYEVAWNQLRFDHLSKKEAQKILSEIAILQSIRNDHIINFYASWSSHDTRTNTTHENSDGSERIVFVTELMSSGTLKQYLKKTIKVGTPLKPKVVKSWCRQILLGLEYLHSHDPPILHRDLKCDNIFINGNNGQLKIGDLGLAVVRHRTHVSSVLGTPEFMAPELYDEKYDEKVDIYAFGMCVLEMVTMDYPYAECTNQAQIYRKVSQGIKPQALQHLQDPEIRRFIERCLDHDPLTRPSAKELLDSEFLKPCAALVQAPVLESLAPASLISLDDEVDHVTKAPSAPSTPSLGSLAFLFPQRSSTSTVSTSSSRVPESTQGIPPGLLPTPIDTQQPSSFLVPTAEFTLTTVDVENKTYHIRSNLIPPTPTSPEAGRNVGQDLNPPLTQVLIPELLTPMTAEPSPAPTPAPAHAPAHAHAHLHSDTKVCSIRVEEYGVAVGDRLNLKMVCTCPVPGSADASLTPGTHEIKFPYDLQMDTVNEVVAEMVREQILSFKDQDEATAKIQEVVHKVIEIKKEILASELARTQAQAQAQAKACITAEQKALPPLQKSQALPPKKAHHRQLKVPPPSDMDQYGTSPTGSLYEPFFSTSSGAGDWVEAPSLIQPELLYGTVRVATAQPPPVMTEATFPPLNLSHSAAAGQGRVKTVSISSDKEVHEPKVRPVSYSDMVQQHPATARSSRSSSPNPVQRERAVSSPRPKSVHDVERRAPHLVAPHPPSTLMSVSQSAKDKIKGSLEDKDEDVGYTSPFRHGVSSSSVNSHRRFTSVDISLRSTHLSNAPNSLRIFNPPGAGFGEATRPKLEQLTVPQGVENVSLPERANSSASVTTSTIRGRRDSDLDPHIHSGSDSGVFSASSSPGSSPKDLGSKSNALSPLPHSTPSSSKPATAVKETSVISKTGSGSSSTKEEGLYSAVKEAIPSAAVIMTDAAIQNIERWSDSVQHHHHHQHQHQKQHHHHPHPHDLISTATTTTAASTATATTVAIAGVSVASPSEKSFLPMIKSVSSSSSTSSSIAAAAAAAAAAADATALVENNTVPPPTAVLDEDLKSLMEQQRREMEWMRLQHEMQWEEMVKQKQEQELLDAQQQQRHQGSGLLGRLEGNVAETPRRKSDPWSFPLRASAQ